jgi:hypothetical protein
MEQLQVDILHNHRLLKNQKKRKFQLLQYQEMELLHLLLLAELLHLLLLVVELLHLLLLVVELLHLLLPLWIQRNKHKKANYFQLIVSFFNSIFL